METETILGLFSADKNTAQKLFKEYMDQEVKEEFIDLTDEDEVMDEEEAQDLFERILQERGLKRNQGMKVNLTDEIIRDFKTKTGLSIRKIAVIVGLNKDKVCKILRG